MDDGCSLLINAGSVHMVRAFYFTTGIKVSLEPASGTTALLFAPASKCPVC